MKDYDKKYNAETWAQWDTGSDECLTIIQNRIQLLSSDNQQDQ